MLCNTMPTQLSLSSHSASRICDRNKHRRYGTTNASKTKFARPTSISFFFLRGGQKGRCNITLDAETISKQTRAPPISKQVAQPGVIFWDTGILESTQPQSRGLFLSEFNPRARPKDQKLALRPTRLPQTLLELGLGGFL